MKRKLPNSIYSAIEQLIEATYELAEYEALEGSYPPEDRNQHSIYRDKVKIKKELLRLKIRNYL